MAEFFKKRQRERKAEQGWLNKFRNSFERAVGNVERHQESRLLTWQIVLLAFFGGFLIDVLASSVYDLLVSIDSQLTAQVTVLSMGIVLTSIILLALIFVALRQQLLRYKPPQPVLSFLVTPEDTMPFLQEEFQSIEEYLEKGELKDFRTFTNLFFESLHAWFSHLFNDKVIGEPIKESEESDLPIYKEFPTMIKEYDVSPLSPSGVRINLKVVLSPRVIYDWTSQGDKTATYSFYVIFRFGILNPEHKDANRFLDAYYHLYASHIVAISSYCIASAVRKLRKPQNKGD